MFCDMVGSSALSTRLDPEEQRDVVSAFQSCCATEIKRLEAMVAQYLGDGVLAYFGYPAAHEDDAERAIRAGLAIIESIGKQQSTIPVTLQARIGIASGVVVVGDLVREGVTQESAAIGETTNLAARLQSIAEPNAIVIGPETYRLVGGLFEYRDLGPQMLKGFGEPLHVRQVIRASKIENRFEVRRAALGSPLLGRDEELDLLWRRWEQAKRGEGQVVLLTGEPGIGKSRLTRALQERLRSEPYRQLTYHCSPYHQDSALYPIIGWLVRAASIERDHNTKTRLDKLEDLLEQSSENLAEDMPLFAALLSIPGGERYPLPTLTPQQLKERTLHALLDQLKNLAATQPVLMVFEDLHWIDPTSLELLSLAIDLIRGERILLLATSRPEFTPPWPSHRHFSTVHLTRLDKIEAEALIAGVTGGKSLPLEVLDQIVARTDGVPLFIEELTKTVLESGLLREADGHFELTGPLPPFAIPSTLHASLLARLDRLASVKDVAQIGATIGREFYYALVAAVAALPEKDLRAALAQLVHSELIFQRGVPPDATYVFKHALVQEVAYASLVRSRRQQLHGSIAHALEQQFPDRLANEPETLAYHFTEAGFTESAIGYWLRAGQRAAERSALVEAANHFSEGIRLVRLLDHPSLEQTRLELDLLMRLGPVIMASRGYSAPESLEVFLTADRLVTEVGDVTERMDVLLGLFNVHYGRAELEQALAVAQQHMILAKQHGRDMARAHTLLGQTYSAMGALVEARSNFQQALDIFATTPEEMPIMGVFGSQRVVCLSLIAGVHYALGETKLAQQATTLSIDHARKTRHAMSIALARVSDLLTPIPGGLNPDPGRAEEVICFCAEHGLKNFEMWARFAQGAISARRGLLAKGIAIMRAAIDAADIMGSHLFRPVQLAALGGAHAKVGEIEEALRLLNEAIQTAEHTGEKQAVAAVRRTYGEILFAAGKIHDGERQLICALDIAREQHAKSEEGRIKSSIARLLPEQEH
jgi:class 3 adenylate cyclase/tetratricopeptide (TPR) repeat protein